MEEERKITLVMADDHEIVRAGLRRLLAVDKSFQILDEADNGDTAINLIKYHNPQIALVDILMPKADGIEVAKVIKKLMPDVIVIILTAFEDFLHIEQAIAAGANGYLSKDIQARELINALYKAIDGERVFSKSILTLLQKKFATFQSDSTTVSISKREQEILNLVAKGKTSAQIADELFISIRTVQSHRANIMTKLGVRNAAGLVRYAIYNSETELQNQSSNQVQSS